VIGWKSAEKYRKVQIGKKDMSFISMKIILETNTTLLSEENELYEISFNKTFSFWKKAYVSPVVSNWNKKGGGALRRLFAKDLVGKFFLLGLFVLKENKSHYYNKKKINIVVVLGQCFHSVGLIMENQ
jgi:hypothetical protein